MSDHRAPNRLANSRPNSGYSRSSSASGMRATGQHRPPATPPESYDDAYEDEYNDLPSAAPASETRSRITGPRLSDSVPSPRMPTPPPQAYPPPAPPDPEPAIYEAAPYSVDERMDHLSASGELSKHVQHQILFDTIRLYNEDWQLARIVASAKTKWLVAYLTPRNKRIDLKTAMEKKQVLQITIDSRGNTDIKEPRRKRFFGLF